MWQEISQPSRNRSVFLYATLDKRSDILSADNNVSGSHGPLSQEQLPGEHGVAQTFCEISHCDVIGIINVYQSGASPKWIFKQYTVFPCQMVSS